MVRTLYVKCALRVCTARPRVTVAYYVLRENIQANTHHACAACPAGEESGNGATTCSQSQRLHLHRNQPQPTPHPTQSPTPHPTPHPTQTPTAHPTPSPTPSPTPPHCRSGDFVNGELCLHCPTGEYSTNQNQRRATRAPAANIRTRLAKIIATIALLASFLTVGLRAADCARKASTQTGQRVPRASHVPLAGTVVLHARTVQMESIPTPQASCCAQHAMA